jgi:hypothetical protein
MEVALRSKPEGGTSLLLSRLTRCRNTPGQTADDAVLTLKILSTNYKFSRRERPMKAGGSRD